MSIAFVFLYLAAIFGVLCLCAIVGDWLDSRRWDSTKTRDEWSRERGARR